MKIIMSVLFSFLLAPVPFIAKKPPITHESLRSGDKKRAFSLFVPSTLPADKKVPLLVTLHGSGHVGLSLVEKWQDLAEKTGFIVAGPDSLDASMWSTPQDGPNFLRDLVEELKAKYPVDPRRVYVFGHSGGAVFGLYMALFEPRYFAAVAVHAGSIDTKKTASLIEGAQRKTPILVFVGDSDAFFPVADVKQTVAALKAGGFPVELTIIPHHTHDYYSTSDKTNSQAWEFLSSKSLGQDPQFQEYDFQK